jgi:hypothetical protein
MHFAMHYFFNLGYCSNVACEEIGTAEAGMQ